MPLKKQYTPKQVNKKPQVPKKKGTKCNEPFCEDGEAELEETNVNHKEDD